jgi:Zn-dependent membrane protease YugP
MNFWFGTSIIIAIICFATSVFTDIQRCILQLQNKNAPNNVASTGYNSAITILKEENISEQQLPIERSKKSEGASFKPIKGTHGKIYLPPEIYDCSSLYARAISAHECGHALQHYYGKSYSSTFRYKTLGSFILCTVCVFFLLALKKQNYFNWVDGRLGLLLIIVLMVFGGICGLGWIASTSFNENDASCRGIWLLKKNSLINFGEISYVERYLQISLLGYVVWFWRVIGIWFLVLACINIYK